MFYSNSEKKCCLFILLILLLLLMGCGKSDSIKKKSSEPGEQNSVPYANAGPDQNVALGASVVLNGSNSVDRDGYEYTLLWKIESLPSGSTAVLDDSTGITPSFIADIFGKYTISLKVHDGTLESLPDEVSIRVRLDSDSLVPDTGQTTCSNDQGDMIECPEAGEPFFGQDAGYQFFNTPSFTRLDAEGNALPEIADTWAMVKDNVTGLIWEVKTDDNTVHDRDNKYPLEFTSENPYNVERFIYDINHENFGGHSDWRLPTIKELAQLSDYENSGTAININYFPKTMAFGYWSCSPFVLGTKDVWYLDFSKGNGYHYNSLFSFHARAVRGAESSSDFQDNNDDTITDNSTRLMWMKSPADINDDDLVDSSDTGTWTDALSYCEELDFAGYSDWRLPNINELRSIVDYSREPHAIDEIFFPNTGIKAFWSSTGLSGNLRQAWYISFHNGDDKDTKKTFKNYVRAVRETKTD